MEIKRTKVLKDMPSEEYHATPDLTRSGLVDLLKSPRVYLWNREHKETTYAMIFGDRFHRYTLEDVPIDPKGLKGPDIPRIEGMAESAKHLLPKDGLAEVSYFFTVDGINCKVRPDLIFNDGKSIIDLKSTIAPLDRFRWEVKKYRYDIQSVFYKMGTGAEEFYFVAVEKKPPYLAGVFQIQDESYAEKDVKVALERYRELEFTGEAESWDPQIRLI